MEKIRELAVRMRRVFGVSILCYAAVGMVVRTVQVVISDSSILVEGLYGPFRITFILVSLALFFNLPFSVVISAATLLIIRKISRPRYAVAVLVVVGVMVATPVTFWVLEYGPFIRSRILQFGTTAEVFESTVDLLVFYLPSTIGLSVYAVRQLNQKAATVKDSP